MRSTLFRRVSSKSHRLFRQLKRFSLGGYIMIEI